MLLANWLVLFAYIHTAAGQAAFSTIEVDLNICVVQAPVCNVHP